MAKSSLAGSASLHLRLGAFGGLYAVLSVTFTPFVAFALTLMASFVLAKL
ncbi:hypothetical protein Q4574_11065 [Aliiglaciecola sp. 3_MG-2023]|nr:hypothetical protein [Aliiglaciecola sp. 3_MG-2023]MDO6693829.1 hypothetical protein [Aliiglaciecola sp. 3_MG-2023]